MKQMMNAIWLSLLIAVGAASCTCSVSVNQTIRIADGETVNSSQTTVNGRILVGADCVIRGDCRTVNGSIEIGPRSQVRDLQTVNGRIELAEGVEVDGDVQTVNGAVTVDRGGRVRGDINTINGRIRLINATVERDLTTHNSPIYLEDGSVVGGDILVKRSSGDLRSRRSLTINISGNSVVEGGIEVRDRDLEVKVYLSKGGKVKGKIDNAEVIEE